MLTKPITSLTMENEDSGISVLFTINKHFGCVNSILSFEGSQNKIVTCSSDKTIRIWDKKGSNLKVFKTHNSGIRKLLKWGKDGFLSASDDGSVQYFSVSDYSVHKTIVQVNSNLYNLLRLNYDLLLVVTGSHELLVVSFSKRKVVKIIEEKTSQRTCPILSKDKSRYQNCFYLNSDVENSPILLMNFSDLTNIETERVFNDHSGQVSSLSSLVVQNETLLCSGGSSVVHMYNTSVGEDDLNYLRRISLDYDVTCLRTVLNRYICCGDEMGMFHIFDSRQGLGNIGRIQLHRKDIEDIAILSLQTGDPLTFVCCSKDRTFKVISLVDRRIESFDKIRYEQSKIRYSKKKRKSPPTPVKNEEGEVLKPRKIPPKKVMKERKWKKKTPPKKKKLRMFSFYDDDEDHEMYETEAVDPLKDAEKFIDRTKRIISPHKYRSEKKKEKREEDEEDFIFFEDTTDDDEEAGDEKTNMESGVVPRVTSTSFFNPPFKKRFGF